MHRRGYDGTTGWSINPMEGPRLVEGDELRQMRDDADRRALIRDAALIASMETVERTEMNAQACYRVRIVWKSGRETTDCYALVPDMIRCRSGQHLRLEVIRTIPPPSDTMISVRCML